MKKIISLFALLVLIKFTFAQSAETGPLPPSEIRNGITYWYGIPVNDIMTNTDLIFEGRILTDSAFFLRSPGRVYTYHTVLVLKQFKGSFKSDTIKIVSAGGNMIINGQSEGTPGAYAFKGDEAVFFATVMRFGNNDPDLYYILYGDQCGFKKVCNTGDVTKEVYQLIEAVTGQPYIEVHPNNCKGQQK